MSIEDARERHNRLVQELGDQLVAGVRANPAEAMLVLESLVARTLHQFLPDRRAAVEFLDSLTARVIGRLPGQGS